MHPRDAPRPALVGLALVAALATVAAGFAAVWVHGATPGPDGAAPRRWPAASAIPRAVDRSTLIMFVHPRCPCTRASLGELRRVLAPIGDRVDAQVWVTVPDGAPADWADRDELTRAATIPGVEIHVDRGGAEARRFGARASGKVVLYDPGGHLRYQGGVTSSRGHAGGNPGADRLAAQLAAMRPVALGAPVFGCELSSAGAP